MDELEQIRNLVAPFLKSGEVSLSLPSRCDFSPISSSGCEDVSFALIVLKIAANAVHAVNREAERYPSKRHGVLISVRRVRRNMAQVIIRDSGGGIPPHLLGKIFGPVSPVLQTHGEGRGLAYARLLCKKAGWDLRYGRDGHTTTVSLEIFVHHGK